MPTPTPAKRSTDGRGWFRAAAALFGAALLGGLVLWLSRPRQPAEAAPSPLAVASLPVRSPEASPAVAPPPRAAPPAEDLEALVKADPARALAQILARRPAADAEAQRLKVLEVRALVALGRIGSARSQAAAYYERWPYGPDVAVLERLTGRHPTPAR